MALNKHDLEHLEKQLRESLKAAETTLKHLDENLDFGDDVDHFDEEADETEEFANRLGVKKVLREKLEHTKRALEKMAKNNYGLCERCGKNIEIEVLHASPESAWCRKCKKSN